MMNRHKQIGKSIRGSVVVEGPAQELDEWQREMKAKHPELDFKPGRALPLGKSYLGHCGKAQRLRNLRHQFHRVGNVVRKDPEAAVALALLREFVQGEPDPDYALMHLSAAALDAAEGTKATWAQAARSLMHKFAHRAVENELVDPSSGAQV